MIFYSYFYVLQPLPLHLHIFDFLGFFFYIVSTWVFLPQSHSTTGWNLSGWSNGFRPKTHTMVWTCMFDSNIMFAWHILTMDNKVVTALGQDCLVLLLLSLITIRCNRYKYNCMLVTLFLVSLSYFCWPLQNSSSFAMTSIIQFFLKQEGRLIKVSSFFHKHTASTNAFNAKHSRTCPWYSSPINFHLSRAFNPFANCLSSSPFSHTNGKVRYPPVLRRDLSCPSISFSYYKKLMHCNNKGVDWLVSQRTHSHAKVD